MATPAPQSLLSHEQLGVLAIHLALSFPLWVRRRKIAYRYIDDTTIRQRHSVDFTLPPRHALPADARPAEGERIYVPLLIADKAELVKFSVSDEAGEVLPLLNTFENGGLATAGLNALLNGISGQNGRGAVNKNSLRGAVERIVMAPGAPAATEAARRALGPSKPLGSVLNRDDSFRALVLDLARGFLMLVPVIYEPGRERVLKFEFYSQQNWHDQSLPTRSARGLIRALTTIGWTDKRQEFKRLPIGWARGSHFEFEAPDDIALGRATLHCVQYDWCHRRRVRVAAHKRVYDRPAINLNVSPRTRYDPSRDGDARQHELLRCWQDTARVELRLRPVTAPVLTPVTAVSVVSAGLLWMADDRLGSLDGQTSAALLLLAPAIIAAFLARPGEHAFATRLLRGVRLLTAVVVASALIAVAVIGSGGIRSDPPAAPTQTTTCTAENIGRDTGELRTYRLRGLRCETPTTTARKGEVRDGAELLVRWSAIVATLAAAMLAIALLITSVLAAARHRAVDSTSRRATQLDGQSLPDAP